MRLFFASAVAVFAACHPVQRAQRDAQPGAAQPGAARPAAARTAAPSPVHITFVADSPKFESAAAEYRRIWAAEGSRIVAAMQSMSGLSFVSPVYADTAITAHVREVASYSGYRDSPMVLRASYSADTKKATLVHELGHRLQAGLFRRDEEEHNPLFLWLYDTWSTLYGQPFADAQVTVEKGRSQRYVDAWNYALSFSTAAERARAWQKIRDERLPMRR